MALTLASWRTRQRIGSLGRLTPWDYITVRVDRRLCVVGVTRRVVVFSMVTCAIAAVPCAVVCTGGGVVIVVGSGRRSSATVEADMVRVLLYWGLMV